jgi:hypothetical protein
MATQSRGNSTCCVERWSLSSSWPRFDAEKEEDEELIHGFSFFSEFGWVALSILVCIRFWGDAIADPLDLAGDIA